MEEVHQFLCPHVPIDKIVVRAEVLKEQLKCTLPGVCVEKETIPVMMCTICNNTDDRTMITDYSQGLLICLGVVTTISSIHTNCSLHKQNSRVIG